MARTQNGVNPDDGLPAGEPEEFDDPRIWRSSLSLAKMGCMGVAAKVAQKPIVMARIYGRLFNVTGPKELPPDPNKPGEQQFTHGVVGQIEGCNLETGEIFKAGVFYAPSGFHEMYLAEVQALLNGGNVGEGVTFAHEYHAIPDSNRAGYTWKVINVLPMERNDPLASLRRRALAGSTVKTPLLMQRGAEAQG